MNRDKNGLPLHSDECPDYDGKRCSRMGFRPTRFCEPALIDKYSGREQMTRWKESVPQATKGYFWLRSYGVTKLGYVHNSVDGMWVQWADGVGQSLENANIVAYCEVPEPVFPPDGE